MLNTDLFKDRGRGKEVFFGLPKFLINKEGGKIVTKKKKGIPVGIQGELEEGEEGWPLVGEFSFDYDASKDGDGANKLEQFPAATVEGANRLFAAAAQAQAGWLNPNVMTKTAFALEVL